MKTKLLLASTVAAFAAAVVVTAQNQQQAVTPAGAAIRRLMQPQGEPPPFTSPEAMQAEFVRRFEASPGFGLSRVVRPIFLAPTPHLTWNGAKYRVTPPELVALEDESVVYAAREHGQIERVGTNTVSRREVRKMFQHRPLTALETNLVLALREGRELIVATNRVTTSEGDIGRIASAPDLLVYGALRAGKTCAACHQCDEGALLGAFAYTLAPLKETPDTPSSLLGTVSNLTARVAGPTVLARSRL